MSDNRFKDFPTKRIPSIDKKKPDYFADFYEDEEYEDDDYDDSYEDDDYDTAEYDQEYDARPGGTARRRVDHSSQMRSYEERKARRNRNGGGQYGNRRKSSIREKSKAAITALYIGLLVVVVAVCVTALILGFQWLMREGPTPDDFLPRPPITENGNDDEQDSQAVTGRPDIRTFSAMITGITTNSRGLTLLNIDTETSISMPLDEDADIINRMGSAMYFSQLRIGQLVDIRYDARFPQIVEIRENARAWNRDARTNVQINIENRTISVGHEAFEFNSQTLVMHRGEHIPISQIRPADSVSIMGLGIMAWLIELDSASGSLQLTNTDHIVNGRIAIGNLHPLFLDEITDPIDIPEGPHVINVEGDNIEPFQETITIVAGQIRTLSLGDIALTQATIEIDVTPANAFIFINDQRVQPMAGMLQVDFGEMTIRVEREGYITEERELYIDSPTNSLTFDLEEEVVIAHIVLFTTPSNAEIYVNGNFVGRATPSITLQVHPGVYNIVARATGYMDYNASIMVSAGDEITRNITLTPVVTHTPDHNLNIPPQHGENEGGGFGIPPPPPPIVP